MNNYTAISIGPIIATLSQVRKPRHLWSASYIFSYLMKIIIEEGEQQGAKLISPARDNNEGTDIGLYPDRAFFVGEKEIDIKTLFDTALKRFSKKIGINKDKLNNYFNLMGASIAANEESEAIRKLNEKLDVLELSNRCEETGNDGSPEESTGRKEVLKLISAKNKESALFKLAFGEDRIFPVNSLAEIASMEIKHTYPKEWENASDFDRLLGKDFSKKEKKLLTEEDLFFQVLQNDIHGKLKSYHKYFCVVQADGDSMGKVIGNLQNEKLYKLSQTLIAFGKAASQKVKDFGGLPVYAGGDDLLFIAPVVSKIVTKQEGETDKMIDANIFDLINEIDALYDELVKKTVEKPEEKERMQKEGEIQTTSMSYGVSINYYKYPLYEVLENARNLLFTDAKEGRNTIACELCKHSGSSFKILLDKSQSGIKQAFEELITIAVEENMVSTTAHKLHNNHTLWLQLVEDDKRMDAFFKKFIGVGEKQDGEESYLIKVRELLKLVAKVENKIPKELIEEQQKEDTSKKENDIKKELSDNKNEKTIYSILRIAKFINGEEVKDE